jgi:hypothetical protein
VPRIGGLQMAHSYLQRAVKTAGVVSAATLCLALAYESGAIGGSPARTKGVAASAQPPFPGCAWPVESTAETANAAAPDPFTAYWLTPFRAEPGESMTIRGEFPVSRFISFAVYNDSFQLFTNSVGGESVPSGLSGYQIDPDRGTTNPWRTERVRRGRLRGGQRFTIRLLPAATAAQQDSENAIPTIDQQAPVIPSGPQGIDYVIFRIYLPAGGDGAVQLPVITVTQDGRSATLPRCGGAGRAGRPAHENTALVSTVSVLNGLRDDGVAMSCTSGCAAPQLRYFGPSADSEAGLFPNPLNGYLEMSFTPRPGYVIVTHGRAPTSPVKAGRGAPGNSVGAHPVSWTKPAFQVLYWSIANYLDAQPYPAVEIGQGAQAQFGATPDYLTRLRHGYYTVVSSLPSDEPSAASLKAYAATWIPMSAAYPRTPEFQLLRNVLPQKATYPQGFAFLAPPANPSDILSPASVRRQMGAYYPQTAECTVRTFENRGWAGCLAATRA